jgi:hypothetical protein
VPKAKTARERELEKMAGTGEVKKSEGDKQNLKPITNEKSRPLTQYSDSPARDTEGKFQAKRPISSAGEESNECEGEGGNEDFRKRELTARTKSSTRR